MPVNLFLQLVSLGPEAIDLVKRIIKRLKIEGADGATRKAIEAALREDADEEFDRIVEEGLEDDA